MQMSSMHNQCDFQPITLRQTHSSHVTDFTGTVRTNRVDQFPQPNVQRCNYVTRFLPYDVRDSRAFTHLANTIDRPGHKQDRRNAQQYSVQHSSQYHSSASVNSDKESSWMAQAYPPIDAGESYFPQNLYSQAQLRPTEPYHYGMSQGTMTYSDTPFFYQ